MLFRKYLQTKLILISKGFTNGNADLIFYETSFIQYNIVRVVCIKIVYIFSYPTLDSEDWVGCFVGCNIMRVWFFINNTFINNIFSYFLLYKLQWLGFKFYRVFTVWRNNYFRMYFLAPFDPHHNIIFPRFKYILNKNIPLITILIIDIRFNSH